jgi:hypothetical protein
MSSLVTYVHFGHYIGTDPGTQRVTANSSGGWTPTPGRLQVAGVAARANFGRGIGSIGLAQGHGLTWHDAVTKTYDEIGCAICYSSGAAPAAGLPSILAADALGDPCPSVLAWFGELDGALTTGTDGGNAVGETVASPDSGYVSTLNMNFATSVPDGGFVYGVIGWRLASFTAPGITLGNGYAGVAAWGLNGVALESLIQASNAVALPVVMAATKIIPAAGGGGGVTTGVQERGEQRGVRRGLQVGVFASRVLAHYWKRHGAGRGLPAH